MMIKTLPLQQSDGWAIASPEAAYLDVKALSNLTRLIERGVEYPNTHAVLIEHAGQLVYEAYLEGNDEVPDSDTAKHRAFDADSLHDLRSVSKSVTSALLGIALGDDYAEALAAPVTTHLEGVWFGPEMGAVTLQHVLTMTAGIEWDQWAHPYGDPKNDEYQLSLADDPVAMVLNRPVKHRPGTVWKYSSGLTQVLAGIIEQRTGKRLDVYAEEMLFKPLGITEFEWHGSRHWRPEGTPSAGWGLRLRARDLAKIGSLFLHMGVWKGRQIVPAEWVRLSGQRHVVEMPWGSRGVYGYGFQWWSGRSKSIPSYQIIGAFGNGGQRLLIVPDRHLAVTVLAGNYDSAYQDNGNRMLGRIAPAHRDHG